MSKTVREKALWHGGATTEALESNRPVFRAELWA